MIGQKPVAAFRPGRCSLWGLAFHRCDKPRKLKKLNKLNQKGKVYSLRQLLSPSAVFELGSSHAHNAHKT